MSALYHSIVGLPLTGKTTYLAALWHVLDAGEVPCAMVLDKLVGDHTHLNVIVKSWRKCERVPRTEWEGDTTVSVHVKEAVTERAIVLDFPDLSGESFRAQFSTRSCTMDYVESYKREGGILLFVSADRAQDGIPIVDMADVLEETPDSEEQEVPELVEWSHDLVPEQVRLVDLLQFLQRPPFDRRNRRIAIIVSAWDVILDPDLEPDSWLRREMPLLQQYLATNSRSYQHRVYGVSAQGGDITGGARAELLSGIPSERVRCVGPEVLNPHDLTAPVVWLTQGG